MIDYIKTRKQFIETHLIGKAYLPQEYQDDVYNLVLPYLWQSEYYRALETAAFIEGADNPSIIAQTKYDAWKARSKPAFENVMKTLTVDKLCWIWRMCAKYDVNTGYESDNFCGDDEMSHNYLTNAVVYYNDNIKVLQVLLEYIADWDDSAPIEDNIKAMCFNNEMEQKMLLIAKMPK